MNNNLENPNKEQEILNINEYADGSYQQSEGFCISNNNNSNKGNQVYYKNIDDVEAYKSDNNIKGIAFKDSTIRNDFIRKVYWILMNQLLITFSIVIWITYHKPTQLWILKNNYIIWIAIILIFSIIIILSCSENIRRLSPINIILLCIFTISEGFLIGISTIFYDKDVILLSICMTIIICLSLTLYAFQTKWDFTIYGGALLICLMVFLLFSIIAIFLPGSKILSLVYASIGAIIFSFYLIYDTQLMIGGDHKYSISPEEYIFAVLNLYLDIINMFMYILAIIGNSRD